MRTPFVLLKAIGRAALHVSGVGGLVEITVDALAEVSDNAWDSWAHQSQDAQRRAELEAIVRASHQEIVAELRGIVAEIAADRTPPEREVLIAYLAQVPALIRQTMRRPADPTGRSLRPDLAPGKPEDLAPFIPARPPRFAPGDRPYPHFDWRLEELIGVGGFGEVWSARHVHFPDRYPRVALKFCTDPVAQQRLLKHEAELCVRVMHEIGEHPGIVALRETYLDADPPCLRYEYVEGGDLGGLARAWHEKGDPVVERATRAVLEVARAAAVGHRLAEPIVHRDLKPANILVHRKDGEVRLKVADYGIGGIAITQAVRATRDGTAHRAYQATAVRGAYSALYASPEQMRGDGPHPRDDVHALGVIWYQLVTGDLTRGRPGGSAWKRRLVENQGLSPALADVMEACFEDADDRPADAGVLVEAIERADRSAPSPAGPTIAGAGLAGSATADPSKSTPASSTPSPPSVPEGSGRSAVAAPTDSLGLRLVRIEPGSYLRGSSDEEIGRLLARYSDTSREWLKDEQPRRRVEISRPFYLGAHPLTVGQFRRFVESAGYETEAERNNAGSYVWDGKEWKLDPKRNWRAPGFPQEGDDHPVTCVSHNDAMAFLAWLNERERDRESGWTYRLPTEAEWEHAARAGTRGLWGETDDPEDLVKVANVADKSCKEQFPNAICVSGDDGHAYTAPVGSFAPNAWGLYDMIGNVWEWCDDWYDPEYYEKGPTKDPHNTAEAAYRVYRGGSWNAHPRYCRPAYRDRIAPGLRNSNLGFRLAAVQS